MGVTTRTSGAGALALAASRWRGPSPALVLGALWVLVLASAVLGITIGSVWIHPLTLLGMAWRALPFGGVEPWWLPTDERILLGLRLPRVVAAAAVGGALGMAGVMFQGL